MRETVALCRSIGRERKKQDELAGGAGEWQALEKRRSQRNVGARKNVRLEKRGVLASNSIPWDTILYHKD